mmetsp:Transcript_41036/g.70204  ORF Transcript_41036/g.70204 Transcript_41036/m.70204 type:complete len:234 (+) Transcript_41036:911-1612(+)
MPPFLLRHAFLLLRPQRRFGIVRGRPVAPGDGAGDEPELRSAVDQHRRDGTALVRIPRRHHRSVVALGALGAELVGVFLEKVLVQEGLVLEEFAAEMEGAAGAAVLVKDAVVFDPFLSGGLFGGIDVLCGGVGLLVDETRWAAFSEYLDVFERPGNTVVEPRDQHILRHIHVVRFSLRISPLSLLLLRHLRIRPILRHARTTGAIALLLRRLCKNIVRIPQPQVNRPRRMRKR